jgi:CRP-like cAMP-binding protein
VVASVQRLKQRLSQTLKAKKLDAALGALALLAKQEPNEPTWPRRMAHLLHFLSDTTGAVAAHRRALELQVDQGLVLDAIVTCKAILDLEPGDPKTLDTLDLLYNEGPPSNSKNSDPSETCQKPLGRSCRERESDDAIEAGQVLFRQGEAANSLYVIVDGAVVPIAEGIRRRKLAVLEQGDFFGEIGLMAKQPRNATIEALVETKLLAIDRRALWELIGEEPAVAQTILRFLRARLIDRQIRTNLFFSAFVHAQRESVARQFRFLEVRSGTTLVEAGKAPEGLFVVLSGSLSLRMEDKEVAEVGLGEVFGGLSLIDGRLAPADVVAKGKCWLVVLGEGRFRRIMDANPCLDRILRRMAHDAPFGFEE